MQKVKVNLYHNTHKGTNTHPIYIRIYINKKTTYKATGYEVEKKHWDKVNEKVLSSHKIASHINNDLTLKKNDILKGLIEQQVAGKIVSTASVKQSMNGKSLTNIFSFVDKYKSDVSGKRKDATLENYRKHLKKLEDFNGSQNLTFEEIDANYLLRYENWLRKDVGNNYTHKLLTTLRSFFNAAIKRNLITCYPFREYEFPTYVSPQKDYLSMSELKKWEAYIPEITDPALKESAIYFLFSCYCGLRVSDWYLFNKKNIDGNRIRLRTKKTSSYVSMPISKPLERVLALMEETPLIIHEGTINLSIKTIAKKLGIKKHITCHTARHTFGVTICLANKISSETAAELMGITLKTFVDNYSQVSDAKIDRETKEAWAALE